jgi:hypothetical protein
MRCYPVSIRINHVANDDEDCSRLVELAEIKTILPMSCGCDLLAFLASKDPGAA